MAEENTGGCAGGCGCDSSPKPFADTYGEKWRRGIGASKKTLDICFNAADHVDGSQWKIARLLPNMIIDDIKLRVNAAMPGVTFDLGFSDTCRGCCCEDEGNEDLTWFAEGVSLEEVTSVLLDGAPWDAASGHCGPECCDLPLKCPPCPEDERPGPECAWDMILTIHGSPEDCACLSLTFEYQNQ